MQAPERALSVQPPALSKTMVDGGDLVVLPTKLRNLFDQWRLSDQIRASKHRWFVCFLVPQLNKGSHEFS